MESKFVFRFLLAIGLVQIVVAEDEQGFDISHLQKIDWTKVTSAATQRTFVMIKASQGDTFKDDKFVENFNKAVEAGFRCCCYHFATFADINSAQAQMKNFKDQLDLVDQTKIACVALDIEPDDPEATYYETNVAKVTLDAVNYLNSINRPPYIYTTKSFWDKNVPQTDPVISKCQLWIARWRETPPTAAELPNGWTAWRMWQNTNKGSIDGIDGDVDLDTLANP